jgi:hypothetical protein
VLLDVFRSHRIEITKAVTGEEQEQERKLSSRIVSLNTQIYRGTIRTQSDQARLTERKARLQQRPFSASVGRTIKGKKLDENRCFGPPRQSSFST